MILLISGKQGSGKSTLQSSVIKNWNRYKSHRAWPINFADPLYKMHDFCVGYLKDHGIERPVKDGPLLQVLGTEWGRNTVGPDIWVNFAKARIQKLLDPTKISCEFPLFVIGDCRFENEFDGFPQALKIRLECDEVTRKARCSSWRENSSHASEVSLDFYAEKQKFDLNFNTGISSVEMISDLVTARLLSMK